MIAHIVVVEWEILFYFGAWQKGYSTHQVSTHISRQTQGCFYLCDVSQLLCMRICLFIYRVLVVSSTLVSNFLFLLSEQSHIEEVAL